MVFLQAQEETPSPGAFLALQCYLFLSSRTPGAASLYLLHLGCDLCLLTSRSYEKVLPIACYEHLLRPKMTNGKCSANAALMYFSWPSTPKSPAYTRNKDLFANYSHEVLE